TDFFGTPRPFPSQQPPACFQETHCYTGFSEGINSQPHSAIGCNRALPPSTSYVPRPDPCFLSTPLSTVYNSSAVQCSPSNPEPKPLSHYPEPADRYTNDSYPPTPSIPLQCISSNLPVQDQDLLFPSVSCPKPPYTTVTSETTILNQAAPLTIHADIYPLYTEPPTHIDNPHMFPMPKACARGSASKTRRPSVEGATRSLCNISQHCISASKPDSSIQLPSCGPNGLSNTTGSRSEAMSFPGISVPPIPSPHTQSGLGFHSPPPAIFLSPVLCSSSNIAVSDSTNLTVPPRLPKTERLSPSSVCSDDRKDTLTVPCAQNSLIWNKSDSKKVESRRITHISAEQKRRCNIKLGFDTLHNLVTSLHGQHSNKLSKATTLQKTAEYISKLQQERAQLQEETQRLRHQVQELSDSINLCQQQLPASGVPVTHQHFQHMRQMFQDYVQSRTLQNWKFWLFSLLIRPLFDSFNRMVSTASMTDLRETALEWLDQHCSLPALRPTVLSSLCQLSTSTSILTDPSLMPEQAVQAVTQEESRNNFY
ncbi:unnamed protein product, partial [Staurois parvus]